MAHSITAQSLAHTNINIYIHTQSQCHAYILLHIQLLKKLKRPHEAVLNFSWALDFSRHGGNSHIREEVDEMYQVSELEGRNIDEDFLVHQSDSDSSEQDGDVVEERERERGEVDNGD